MLQPEDNPIVKVWRQANAAPRVPLPSTASDLLHHLQRCGAIPRIHKRHIVTLNEQIEAGWRPGDDIETASLTAFSIHLAYHLGSREDSALCEALWETLSETCGYDEDAYQTWQGAAASAESYSSISDDLLAEMGLDGELLRYELPSYVRMSIQGPHTGPAETHVPHGPDQVTPERARLMSLLNTDGMVLSGLVDRWSSDMAPTSPEWDTGSITKLDFVRAIRALKVLAHRVSQQCDCPASQEPDNPTYEEASALAKAVSNGQPIDRLVLSTNPGRTNTLYAVTFLPEETSPEVQCLAEAFSTLLDGAKERVLWRCAMPQFPAQRLDYFIGIGRHDSPDCGVFHIPPKGREHCGRDACEKKHRIFADLKSLNKGLSRRAEDIADRCARKHGFGHDFDDLWKEAKDGRTLKEALFRFCQFQKPTPI